MYYFANIYHADFIITSALLNAEYWRICMAGIYIKLLQQ